MLCLQDAYLPTMQDDLLHEVIKAHEGSANEMPKFYSKHAHMPMCTIV